MRIKQSFIKLMATLMLVATLLSVPVFATGEDAPEMPDQSQDTEDTDGDSSESSSNNSSVGGGLNSDGGNQPPVSDQPTQPETPSVSKPLPQPEDPDTETRQPVTTPSVPTTSKPTLPAVTIKPQPQLSNSGSTTNPEISSPDDAHSAETSTVIPTAPSDSIAPTEVETPLTGTVETQTTPVNPFAIILMIVTGITIIAAGIISTLLSKAAQRSRTII